MGSDGHKESCVRWGSRSPHGKGQFLTKGAPVVKYRDFAVSFAETAEAKDLPFGLWKEAQVQSYSPGVANVPTVEGTLAPPGEYY